MRSSPAKPAKASMFRMSGASPDWTLVRTTSLMLSQDWTSRLTLMSGLSASKSLMMPSHSPLVASLYDGTSRSMDWESPLSPSSAPNPHAAVVMPSVSRSATMRTDARVFFTIPPLVGYLPVTESDWLSVIQSALTHKLSPVPQIIVPAIAPRQGDVHLELRESDRLGMFLDRNNLNEHARFIRTERSNDHEHAAGHIPRGRDRHPAAGLAHRAGHRDRVRRPAPRARRTGGGGRVRHLALHGSVLRRIA